VPLFRKSFLPAIAWLVIVTVLMLLPGSEFPQEKWFQKIWLDKWLHFGLFFTLVFLFQLPVIFRAPTSLLSWRVGIMLTGVIYGIVIEFIQKFWVPGRTFDLGDIAFDGLGCIAAYVVGSQSLKK
jgi:VanZ family protein